jgi:hypothetical protein
MRFATLLFVLALAGCAVGEPGSAALTTTPAPQASAAAPAVALQEPVATSIPSPNPPPEPERQPLARAATPPQAPAPAAEPQEPMTHERASSICWMKYEDGRHKMSLDQRADLVDKCVKATLAGEKVK